MEKQIKNLKSAEFKEFKGRTIQELKEHLEKEYKGQLPTQELRDYIADNPEKAPEWMKDGKWYFFFGSLFRYSGGYWYVPCVRWDGSEFSQDGYWLGRVWLGAYRVVLLGAIDSESLPLSLEFSAICPSHSKTYEVFALGADKQCYGRIKNKWKLLK